MGDYQYFYGRRSGLGGNGLSGRRRRFQQPQPQRPASIYDRLAEVADTGQRSGLAHGRLGLYHNNVDRTTNSNNYYYLDSTQDFTSQ